MFTHFPPKEEFYSKLVVWKDIRCIHDACLNLKISSCFLEACSLVYLTHLKTTGYMDRNDMKSFASNIRNAPHLTQLTFRYATMNLGDMEQLHANLPKLEILLWVFGMKMIHKRFALQMQQIV